MYIYLARSFVCSAEHRTHREYRESDCRRQVDRQTDRQAGRQAGRYVLAGPTAHAALSQVLRNVIYIYFTYMASQKQASQCSAAQPIEDTQLARSASRQWADSGPHFG